VRKSKNEKSNDKNELRKQTTRNTQRTRARERQTLKSLLAFAREEMKKFFVSEGEEEERESQTRAV
jgi:hypothetical protein